MCEMRDDEPRAEDGRLVRLYWWLVYALDRNLITLRWYRAKQRGDVALAEDLLAEIHGHAGCIICRRALLDAYRSPE